MKKNTTNTGFLPWENNFSPEEQQALKNSDWNDIAGSATPAGWIPDSPKAVAALGADYERLFNASLAEDLKKHFTWLLFILAFTSAFFWHRENFYQNDPNSNNRACLLEDVSDSPGDTLLGANPTETPPGVSLGKMPPGATKNKNTKFSNIHCKSNKRTNMNSIELALYRNLYSEFKVCWDDMDSNNCSGINFINLTSANTKDSTILSQYGIYNELPENRKWCFIDKNDVFINYTDQFAAYAHRNSISSSNTTAFNSIRLRIGDVDKLPSNPIKNVDRNKDSLYVFLITTDACDHENTCYNVKTNQVFKVMFKSFAKTQGYQFTLNHAGLELIDILPGQSMGLDNFGVFAKEQAVTTSWNGDLLPEFAIKFRAKQPGKLTDLLSVSSRITKAVAYGYADARPLEVALRFEGPEVDATHKEALELYQNVPNPFADKTTIGFTLPTEGKATLTVTDKMGRALFTRENACAKGYNTFVVDRTSLPVAATDVLYYTVKTSAGSATKKMDVEIK